MQLLKSSIMTLMLLWLPLSSVLAEDASATDGPELQEAPADQDASADEVEDDTPDIETETTVDYTEAITGLKVGGDLRPIYNYFGIVGGDGVSSADLLPAGHNELRVFDCGPVQRSAMRPKRLLRRPHRLIL